MTLSLTLRRWLVFTAACACTGLAAAQAPGTRLVTLGTQGGPLPSATRAQASNAVVVNGAIYLVDAGNGVLRQLAQAGLEPRRVGQVFITHNHDDHNADWGTLMGANWSAGRMQPTTVYGPAGTEAMLQGFLAYFAPAAQIRLLDSKVPRTPQELFKAKDVTAPGLVYQDAHVKVTATPVCHYHFGANAEAGKAHVSWAYRFDTADRSIVFSGDTGECAAQLVPFAKGADLLVHEVIHLDLMGKALKEALGRLPVPAEPGRFESMMRHMAEDHTSPEDIGRLAQAAGVKAVVLTHLLPGAPQDRDSDYTDGVKKFFDGPVTAARDLMSF
jgi:ribonuclease BN (tRNA processing enzyme)